MQSLGVFTAALVIFFKPEWKIVDPICTFIFSVLVLGTTISILRNTMNVLMEGKIGYIYKHFLHRQVNLGAIEPGVLAKNNHALHVP